MRNRIFVVLLITILSLSIIGCNKTNNTSDNLLDNSNNQQTHINTVTNTSDLITTYKNWAEQLDSIAERTKSAYQPWEKGEVPVEKYLEQTKSLYEEMKKLNIETDLKTEIQIKNASSKDKELTQKIIKSYQKASKDLNDFLVTSNTRGDAEIKAKYKELIEEKYADDLKELRNLLNEM